MMPYQPKPWPPVANRHRRQAMDQAGDIRSLVREAKRAIRERNYDLVLALLVAVDKSAKLIVDGLEAAPGPMDEGGEGEEDE
jgi:hypothetical protein